VNPRNYDLKEDIREYWSLRAETFDLAFGHRIAPGPEQDAWTASIRSILGDGDKKVLELACGTGEITKVILSLGHDVTAIDFSEKMLAVARKKHSGSSKVRFVLGDAENTMEADDTYDAIVCRHLVWTLTDPRKAIAEWLRVLKPGGKLIVFDGNWATKPFIGRCAEIGVRCLERFIGHDPLYENVMTEKHAGIMARLPFSEGLTFEMIAQLLDETGYTAISRVEHGPITSAQRQRATLRNRLRTLFYARFAVVAERPLVPYSLIRHGYHGDSSDLGDTKWASLKHGGL